MKVSSKNWEIEPWMENTLAIVSQDDNENGGEVICVFDGPNKEENAKLVMERLK